MNVKKLILSGLLIASVVSCGPVKQLKEANTQFRSGNYCEAAAKCALAYSKINRKSKSGLNMKGEMAFKTAESYRFVDDIKNANEWYERAILLKYQQKEPLVLLYNADMLRQLADNKKAIENYTAYKNLVPDDPRAEIGIQSCKMYEEFKENRTRHTVSNVKALNKEGFEIAPMFVDKKETKIAFGTSSERPGIKSAKDLLTCEGRYMDIFVAELDKKGNWLEPKPIEGDSINTEDYSEGTLCIDGRGKTMFFTRCPNIKKRNLGCDIYMSELEGRGWGRPKKLSLKPSDTLSVGHPCVTDDAKFLIFASDMPGGQGGKDLWYTTYEKKGDTWTPPVNMGPEINTAGDELFPSFAKNGDLIYSSNGLPGMGGLDLYRAEKVGDKNQWEKSTNLGSPINSDFNDYALVEVNDRKGYFTSERKGNVGVQTSPDIWMYELPPNIFSLKVNVFDLTDKTRQTKIDGVKVIVTGSNANEKWEGLTAKDGSVYWDKKPNGDRYIAEDSDYKIQISKEGYYEDKNGASISTKGLKYNQDFVLDMGLFPKARPIRLPEVRYPLAKWDLLVDSTINSKDSLIYVYDLLIANPGLVLELSSHTDPRGNDVYNQVLSENRAKACYKYLVEEKGVDPRRIIPVGKGEREPRTVYLLAGKYLESEPKDAEGNPIPGAQVIVLKEAYMNQFKKTNKKLFDQLQQFNRRTEGKVVTLEFDATNALPANPDFLIFKALPKAK
ncbi:OmpA family protein [Fluviicola taffensis]|uniref:OmpA/MotB domain protein n=1 Tax=Fluviicola taffensis (strain DSM 16823 / NCIMB 13979 / RW262) TaxID=755732 RepID=F2I9C8_FLUTR|nr:OmpA family protein [Fluviicola taffensis]AEA44085.1 OmpA/MotB domain protein [Fluviicola taffensis DSM 16823]